MAAHTEHNEHHNEDSHDLSHHIRPIKEYAIVYGVLMVLMAATIAVSYVKFPIEAINVIVALVIAIIKAVLVVLFFMGVKHGTRLTWVWASLGFIWFLLMFGTLGDYVTRNWIQLPSGW